MQFRTKARAVDLLGKGQIADLPTAITELWKNGYDAYADKLTAELYLQGYQGLKNNIFVISDDGRGMSRNDIIEKWLVLGTDSKSRDDLEAESIETLWKKPRIKAGNKGIGRLSVAYLGSPMLMLTKKIGSPLQAVFFDWRLLENYNLFLDDIHIPIQDIEVQTDFKPIFEKLKSGFLKNFDKTTLNHTFSDEQSTPLIWEKSQETLKQNIITTVESLEIFGFFEQEILSNLIDITEHHGTKFLIFEPNPQIIQLVATATEPNDEKFDEHVKKSLFCFTNPFTEVEKLPIHISFLIHKETGETQDWLLQMRQDLFTPADFDLADIIIDGDFDGKGSFSGKLQFYNNTPFSHTYSTPRKKDKIDYGNFHLKLAYSMGKESESKLEGAVFRGMSDKIARWGGLFIYRDGFMIAPYGRQDSDFLEFEKRRSLRAGDYFWSHRRMFGYISISRIQNHLLTDKASREGLVANTEYRHFKSDLIAFFSDLAANYFRTDPKSSLFEDKKSVIKQQVNALKQDKERETKAKIAFTNRLKNYPQQFEAYKANYQKLLTALKAKIAEGAVLYTEIEQLLGQIQQQDIDFKKLLPNISKAYKPTEAQMDKLHKYEQQINLFLEAIQKESAVLMVVVQEQLDIRDLKKDYEKQFQKYKSELDKLIFNNQADLEETFKKLLAEHGKRARLITTQFSIDKKTVLNAITSKEDVVQAIQETKSKFEWLRAQIENELLPLVHHIKKLNFDIDEDLIQGTYKEYYNQIKLQWEETQELAQLGIAVEIIDHEFNVLYARINHLLKQLGAQIPTHSAMLFDLLQKAFKDLEAKYALLSPMYQISGATSKRIEGNHLITYIKTFFEQKLKTDGIEIVATPAFEQHIIQIKEPIIHTVLVNIVNNAIYWLKNAAFKQIKFDFKLETNEILIMNSGATIEQHRLEKIFELFYSSRPNGRGIGLYLCKHSLNTNTFDIYATNDPNYNQLNGACFVIKSLTK